MGSQTLVGLASLGLAIVAHYRAAEWLIYTLLVVTGIARSFLQPAKHALIPLLVPETHFTNAVTWNSSGFHLASVLGPALGGWLIYQTGSAQTVLGGPGAQHRVTGADPGRRARAVRCRSDLTLYRKSSVNPSHLITLPALWNLGDGYVLIGVDGQSLLPCDSGRPQSLRTPVD